MFEDIVKNRIELKKKVEELKKELKESDENIKKHLSHLNLTNLTIENLAKISYTKITSKRLDTKAVKEFLGEQISKFEKEVQSERLTVTEI